MRYERKGSGAMLWVGDQPLKASCIGREFSGIRMEERLGEFQPDSRGNSMPIQPRTAEPLRPDMPANWAEYRKTLGANRKQKDAAQAQQRMDHLTRVRCSLRSSAKSGPLYTRAASGPAMP